MSESSQSRFSNRGPLIAVIRIQLDDQNHDKIFLHLNDDDLQIAEQFIEKHQLNPSLTMHIFQRIRQSRLAIQNNHNQFQYSHISHTHTHNNNDDQQVNNQGVFKTPNNNMRNNINNDEGEGDRKQRQWDSPVKKNKKINNMYEEEIRYSQQKKDNMAGTFGQWYQSQRNEHKNQQNDINGNFVTQTNSQKNMHKIDDQNQKTDNYKLNPTYSQRMAELYNVNINGLKLGQSKTPHHIHELKQQNPTSKQKQIMYSSSQSSEGLFGREIHHHHYTKSSFNDDDRENEIKRFVEMSENVVGEGWQKEKEYHGILEGFRKRPAEIMKQNIFTKNKLKQQSQSLSIIHKYAPLLEPSLPESSSGSFDYISFKDPHPQSFQQINHIRSQNKQIIKSSINIQKENSLSYKQNNNIGLIRSNSKMKSLRQNQTPKQNVYNDYKRKEEDYQETRRCYNNNQFNEQDQLFGGIKELRVKNMQQNRQINGEITSRPTKVKILHKQQIESMRQSTMSRSMSKSDLSRINKQVTSRLYNESQIKKKYLDRLKSKAKNIKNEEQIENGKLTLKPEINHLSRAIAEGRKKEQTLEDYLFEKAKVRDIKVQEMISSQARKQLEECSFRPQINELSHKLASSRSRSRLSTTSQGQAKLLNKNHSSTNFRPSINKLSNQIVKTKGNFEQRQQRFLQQKNGKLFKKIQEQRLKEKADIISGRQFYQPQLTERTIKLAQQQKLQKRDNQTIHSYLYQLSKLQKRQVKPNPRPTISQQSQKIITQMYDKRLIWLFSQLDSDEDGMISSRKICIDSIPTEILEIIAPVLYEMEELSTELSIEDFRSAVRILHRNLDPYEKSVLYNYRYTSKIIRL